MSLPLVSIVIPSYKPAYFEQALRSALGQTYPNIEIVVSDNCPTDAIRDICARYPGVIYQRCSVFRAHNVMAALFSGKGEFIKPLFDDDILHPFCVERMVAAASAVPDVDLVFSASAVIDKDNVVVRQRVPYSENGVINGRDLYRTLALMANVVGEFTSILVRRQRLWDIGNLQAFSLADTDFTRGLCDAVFYCKMAHGKLAYYLNQELSYFRLDMRLSSNSNPETSPDFGYVLGDTFELWRAAHLDGVISDAELRDTRERGHAVYEHNKDYPQVRASYQRYLDYIDTLAP
ncbi:MAG: glycosyltransferase family 2 protein [Duganella sp.]